MLGTFYHNVKKGITTSNIRTNSEYYISFLKRYASFSIFIPLPVADAEIDNKNKRT